MNDPETTGAPKRTGGNTKWRIGLLVTTLVMGAALLTSGLDRYFAATQAARAIAEAEIFSLLGGARREVARGSESRREFIDAMFEEGKERGVTYLGVFRQGGKELFALGEPRAPISFPRDLSRMRGPGPHIVHLEEYGVVQAYSPAVKKKNRRMHRRGAKMLVLEIEPKEAQRIVSSARRALVVEIGAAVLLLAAAAVFWRLSRKSDRMELELEKERREAELQLERDRQLKTLGQMSAVLGHEIRNPLAALKGNAQLLLEGIEEEHPQHAKAARVVDAAVQLETLSNQVLDFAKTGALSFSKVYLDDLANSAVTFSEIEDVKLEIAGDGEEPDPFWVLDRKRMEQVLVNLLTNARNACPDGEISLRMRAGDDLVIRVVDQGPGIPPGEEEKIFEPFVTGRAKGTGLGLALVKRIVESHGGRISAGDEEGAGAVFQVVLPPNKPKEEP